MGVGNVRGSVDKGGVVCGLGVVVTGSSVGGGSVLGGRVRRGVVTGAVARGEQERANPLRLRMPSEVILKVSEGAVLV